VADLERVGINEASDNDQEDYDPTAHPLWAHQVDIERGMQREGAEAVRDRVAEMSAKGRMTGVRPVQRLMDEWLPTIAKGVREWCRQMEAQRGPKPIVLPILKEQDPYVVALIALREVLDSIAVERTALVGLASAIGATVEHEAKIRAWEAKEPDLFYAAQKSLDRNHSTGDHRRRVNLAKFSQHMAAGEFDFGWTSWGRDVQRRIGFVLIDIIVRYAPWFEIASDPTHVRSGPKDSPPLVLSVREGLSSWLSKAVDHLAEVSTRYKPCVIPPRRWTGSRKGGYWTPYVMQKQLVRFKASQESQQGYAADEYDAIDMPQVYKAIHALQETGWAVNTRVLDVMEACVVLDQEIGGLPRRSEYEYPRKTPRMVIHKDRCDKAKREGLPRPKPDQHTEREIVRWKQQAGPIYAMNAKRFAKVQAAERTIGTARQFADYEAIYFPYMLDFRGRIYPIPTGLQPQGDDIARGLLHFSDALPVNEEAAEWLAIHLAACYGKDATLGLDLDKEPFQVRLDWSRRTPSGTAASG
jgi:DNA-directed RNA polymerase